MSILLLSQPPRGNAEAYAFPNPCNAHTHLLVRSKSSQKKSYGSESVAGITGSVTYSVRNEISIIQRKSNVSGMKCITKSWICGGFVPALTALRRRISPLKTMELCSKTLFLIPETKINTFLMKYAFEWYHTSHILNHISLCLESDKCHVEFHVDLANLTHHFKVLIKPVQHVKFLRIWASSRGERAPWSWMGLSAATSRRALRLPKSILGEK